METRVSDQLELDKSLKEQGVKKDEGKIRPSLIPAGPHLAAIRVMTSSIGKYEPWDWVHVPGAEERYMDALERHLLELKLGHDFDPDTGEDVVAHILASAYILLAHRMARRDGKSRPDIPKWRRP